MLKAKLITLLADYAQTNNCDFRAAMRDVVTDLMHIADSYDLDFESIIDSADEVTRLEIEGELE